MCTVLRIMWKVSIFADLSFPVLYGCEFVLIDGVDVMEGRPWFLTNLTLGTYHYYSLMFSLYALSYLVGNIGCCTNHA